MINPAAVTLALGNLGMNPGEQLHRIFSRAGNPRGLAVGRLRQNLIGLPARGTPRNCRGQALLSQALEVVAALLGHSAPRGKTRFSVWSLHGYHHLGLAAGAPGQVYQVSEP
jgi:hypothetical protein